MKVGILAGGVGTRRSIEKVRIIEDVVLLQLCTGCGACASIERDRYRMVDDPLLGRRPISIPEGASTSGPAMQVCPGHRPGHEPRPDGEGPVEYDPPACFVIWLKALNWSQKVRSIIGTVRRVFRRKLHRRVHVQPATGSTAPDL